MAELPRLTPTPRARDAAVQVARLAERQWGIVTRMQLQQCGLSGTGVSRWVHDGRLHRVHPGVYAVGHRALGVEGRLAAALFYAGPGAMLSHVTAAWWWQLLRAEPRRIHVSTPGRRRSLPEVSVHHPRRLDRTSRRRLPVTTVPRTLLDVAAVVPFDELRRALAEAEYRRLLSVDEVEAVLGRGHPGSAALRFALTRHRPQFARTLSVLEERFLALCEASGIPLPEVNVKVRGRMIDALWRRQRVIVELDGHAAHATPAAIERDRHRELALRASGHLVLRYTWRQITEHPERVAADLRGALTGEPLAGPPAMANAADP